MRDEATILLATVLLGTVAAMPTPEPDWAPTGRLSQFRGFVTPRPTGIPENAQMMYASVWAAWSAWSFCSNRVRMRVRACNTVRGFSCLGPNQETRPCDAILPPSGPNIGKTNTDYDIVDPWEQDRREAMKQLYPDEPSAPADNSNFVHLSGAHPPSRESDSPSIPPYPKNLNPLLSYRNKLASEIEKRLFFDVKEVEKPTQNGLKTFLSRVPVGQMPYRVTIKRKKKIPLPVAPAGFMTSPNPVGSAQFSPAPLERLAPNPTSTQFTLLPIEIIPTVPPIMSTEAPEVVYTIITVDTVPTVTVPSSAATLPPKLQAALDESILAHEGPIQKPTKPPPQTTDDITHQVAQKVPQAVLDDVILAQEGPSTAHKDTAKVPQTVLDDVIVAQEGPVTAHKGISKEGPITTHRGTPKVPQTVLDDVIVAQEGPITTHKDTPKVPQTVLDGVILAQEGLITAHQGTPKVPQTVLDSVNLAQEGPIMTHKGTPKVPQPVLDDVIVAQEGPKPSKPSPEDYSKLNALLEPLPVNVVSGRVYHHHTDLLKPTQEENKYQVTPSLEENGDEDGEYPIKEEKEANFDWVNSPDYNMDMLRDLYLGKISDRILRPLPPAPTALVDHELVGFEDRRPVNEADGSPGIDPEKLFGAKQFAAKTLKFDAHKERKHKEEQFNQLVAMGSNISDEEEDTENLNSSSFEDITFDTTTTAPPTTTTSTTTTTTTTTTASTTTSASTTPSTTTTTSTAPLKVFSKTFPKGPRRGFGITALKQRISPFVNKGLAHYVNYLTTKQRNGKELTLIFNRSQKMRDKLTSPRMNSLDSKTQDYKRKWRESSTRLREILKQLEDDKAPEDTGNYFISAFSEDALWPSALLQGGRKEESPPKVFGDGNGISFEFSPLLKPQKGKKHSGDSDIGTQRFMGRLSEIHKRMDTTKKRLEHKMMFIHSHDEDSKPRKRKERVPLRGIPSLMFLKTLYKLRRQLKDKVSKELRLGEEIAKSFAVPNLSHSTEDKTTEMVDGSFEEAEVIGDHPVRVQPKLPPSAVDDNLEDLLEVAADEQPEIQTVVPKTTTTVVPAVRISAETEDRDQPEISLPLAETDIINSMRVKEERMEMKVVAPWNGKKKKKSFGITGFALRKSKEVKEEKAHRLHDGQVAHIRIGPTTSTTTTTTTTTEAPTTTVVERIEAEAGPDISTDTLNALDWMLKNMSLAAATEDKEFLNQFVTDIGIPPRQQPSFEPVVPTASAEVKPSFPIKSEEEQVSAAPVVPVKTKKAKTTGKKKSKKGKKEKPPKLHSGEWAPRNLKSKMFPKFKARAVKVMKTRALGVRTVNSDKDRIDVNDKEKLMAGVEDPEKIYEEIRQLQAEMQQMEKQLSVLNSNEQKEALQSKTLNDPLISSQPSHGFGETKFVTKVITLQSTSHRKEKDIETQIDMPEPVKNILGSDPLRILSSVEQIIETKWSDWSEWGQCFCGKQLRTRNCIFGGSSNGCEGPSHETRICTGGECPKETHSAEATEAPPPPPSMRTGVLNFSPSSLRSRPHRLP